jgi:hypothetical protein
MNIDTVNLIKQQTEELKIPEEFIQQFIIHYENRDKWYTIEDIVDIYHNYDRDESK